MKSNTLEFIIKAKEKHGDKYDYSDVKYIHSKTKVTIKCNKCGLIFLLTPNSHLKGSGCPKCGRESAKFNILSNTEEFILKAKKVHNNRYNYSKVNYINSSTKVCIICPEHGKFWLTPANHLSGRGCKECGKQYLGPDIKSLNEFIEECLEIHNNKYDYSKVDYKGANSKIVIVCPIHGEFIQLANSHLRGHGCPKCKKSKGENLTELILKSLLIPYYTLYYIGYKGNFMLVDFYIELNNSKYIIEYNGMQHYVPIKYFGGEVLFERQLTRDNRLKKYCLENNIKLLEIKYDNSKEQIQELVTNFLNNND